MHRADAKLVADALDRQIDNRPVKGQLGRNTHGLGISVLESSGGVYSIILVCTWMYCTSINCQMYILSVYIPDAKKGVGEVGDIALSGLGRFAADLNVGMRSDRSVARRSLQRRRRPRSRGAQVRTTPAPASRSPR